MRGEERVARYDKACKKLIMTLGLSQWFIVIVGKQIVAYFVVNFVGSHNLYQRNDSLTTETL